MAVRPDYRVGTQPLPGMYSWLPEGLEAQPETRIKAAKTNNTQSFDMPPF